MKKVPKETRICALPECNITFEVKPCSKKKYCCTKHGGKANRGENNPAKRSEVREKIRQSKIGHVVTEETRRKISKAKKGKKHSEETKEKLRKNHKGMKGKHHSEESKEKNRQAHLGKKRSKESILKGLETRKKNGTYGKSWNKGLTKETDERVARSAEKLSKYPIERRKCLRPECGNFFFVRSCSKQKYCCKECADVCKKGRSLKGHPAWNKGLTKETDWRLERISGINSPCWVPREVRFCDCGCKETFICKVTSRKRFVVGHASRVENGNYKNIPLPEPLRRVLLQIFEKEYRIKIERLLSHRAVALLDVFFILGLLYGYRKVDICRMIGVGDWFVVHRIKQFNRKMGTNFSSHVTVKKGNLNNPLSAENREDWADWFVSYLKGVF